MPNRTPKLALVVPTIGRLAELRRMLKSLAEQSQPPHQVIILDEGEEGEDFAGEFPQLNIQILSMPAGSTSAKRNAGARAAAHDITLIGFLDDDIVLEPGALEAMLTFWEQAPPATGGAGFNLVNFPPLYASWLKSSRIASLLGLYSTEKGAVLRSGVHTLTGCLRDTTYVSWLHSCAVIYRRKVAEEFGFDDWYQGYSYLEDLDFSYQVGKKYKLAVVAGARFYHYPSPRGREDTYLFGKKEVVNRLYFVRKHRELSLFWCYFALLGRTFLSLTLGVSTREVGHFKRAWGNCVGFFSVPTKSLRSVARPQSLRIVNHGPER